MSRKRDKGYVELPDVFVVRKVAETELLKEPLHNLAQAIGKRAVFYDTRDLALPLFKLSSVDSFRTAIKDMNERERQDYLDEFQSYLYGVDGYTNIPVMSPEAPIRTDSKTGELVFDLENGSDTDDNGLYCEPSGKVDYLAHRAVRAVEDHFETLISTDHRGYNIGTMATKSTGLVHSHIVVGRINDEYLDHDCFGYKELTLNPYNVIPSENLRTIPPFPSQISLGAMQLVVNYRHHQSRRARQLIYSADGRL